MAAMAPSAMPVSAVLLGLPQRRQDEAKTLIALMGELTEAEPVVWASKIIGFGQYEYRYDSGHGGIAPQAAFAPTTRHHTIYLQTDYQQAYPELVSQLVLDPAKRGAPRMSKACLYISRLDTVDQTILAELIRLSCTQ